MVRIDRDRLVIHVRDHNDARPFGRLSLKLRPHGNLADSLQVTSSDLAYLVLVANWP